MRALTLMRLKLKLEKKRTLSKIRVSDIVTKPTRSIAIEFPSGRVIVMGEVGMAEATNMIKMQHTWWVAPVSIIQEFLWSDELEYKIVPLTCEVEGAWAFIRSPFLLLSWAWSWQPKYAINCYIWLCDRLSTHGAMVISAAGKEDGVDEGCLEKFWLKGGAMGAAP